MKFVVFENEGTLEADLITSFGVSVKNDESCIGYFGTGLKYALAILMRQGARVQIKSGGQTFLFGTKEVTLKGKLFKFVTMNGQQLPFTTELGKTWEPWMAYRELYSNAKDEGGSAEILDQIPDGSRDTTQIIVAGGGFETLHAERGSIFVEGQTPIAEHIYPAGGSFFVKGVCVWKYEGAASLYSYDDPEGDCDLTEDRQIKNTYEVHRRVSNLIAGLTDLHLLETIVQADRNLFEAHVDFDYCYVTPSKEFMEVVLSNRDDCLNKSMVKYAEKHVPAAPLQKFELNDYQQKLFEDAVFSVKMAGFMVDEFPIEFVINLRNGALGQAKGGKIYIAQDCFLVGGLEMLKATLIEEWVHLKYKHQDCGRPMQNYLFAQVVRLVDLSNSIAKQKYAA